MAKPENSVVFRLATLLVGIGLIGLVLPIFGIQFVVVTLVAEFLGISSVLASVVVIALGLALVLGPAYISLFFSLVLALLKLPFQIAFGERFPTMEELEPRRPTKLTEDAFRRIYPYYRQMNFRGRTEEWSVIKEDIARQAGVTPDEVGLFNFVSFKALAARNEPTPLSSQEIPVIGVPGQTVAQMEEETQKLKSMSRKEKEAWLNNKDYPYGPALLSFRQQVEEWKSMSQGDEVWIKDEGNALDGLKATIRSASMKENSAEVDVDVDGVQKTVGLKLHMLRKHPPAP